MRAVDTNVLVRAITGDDPVQSPLAKAFIQNNAPVWVSHAVLAETFWVLESVFECEKPELLEAMKRIVDNRDLVMEDSIVVRSALARYASRGKTCFGDFLILEIARKAGNLPLTTFDKALAKAEGAQLLS